MTLPTGQLSLSQVATELNLPLAGLSLQHGWVRALAGVAGAACDFNSLRGQTGRFDGAATAFFNGSRQQINLGVPFFGGVLADLFSVNTGHGFSNTLERSVGTRWDGQNVRVINNSTGASLVFTWDPANGVWSGGTAQIVTAGATHSFTIVPST